MRKIEASTFLALNALKPAEKINGAVRATVAVLPACPTALTVHRRRASMDFPMRPAAPSATGGQRPSRFSREVCLYMLGVSDRAEPRPVSRWRRTECGLPLLLAASAPRRDLSRLNTRPARPPVNVSPPPLQAPTHDSGPVWVADPSPYGSFIHYTSPV